VRVAPDVLADSNGAIQFFVDQAVAKVKKTGKGSYADDMAREGVEKQAREQAINEAMISAAEAYTAKEVAEGRMPSATRYFVMKAKFMLGVPGHVLMQAGLGFDLRPLR